MNQTTFGQKVFSRPMATVAEYYARHLNDKAHAFLEKNCLSACEELGVGFADRTLGKQMLSKQYKFGREVRKKLTRLGILKSSGHEAFRGFVTVPLTDDRGNTTGIFGLRVDSHGKNQPDLTIGAGIFNHRALTAFHEIIICDSVLAAWTFHAAGHSNAVAIVGLDWSRAWFQGVQRVLLAGSLSPSDFAMDGIEHMRIHFPEGMTVHEYAVLNRRVPDALGRRIRAASIPSDDTSCQSTNSPVARPSNQEKPAIPSATPVPVPLDDIDVSHSETEVTLHVESRRWRVRGLDRNTTNGVMRVNLLVFNDRNERFHVDSLDLYHSRSRRVYLKEASEETAISEFDLRSDLGRVLLKLEQIQAEQRANRKAEKQPVEINDAQRDRAMDLLKDEHLLDRILRDFESCGIVGERAGKLAGYLAVTSRLLDKPLGLIIQSPSAAGKSTLADSILKFMPPEEQFACSAMTSQSLYYLGEQNLKHKILSVAEEEGMRNTAYQLKLLQSEGHLSLVSTTKESGTGRTATERYEVDGPVALVMTTTKLDVDPELLNRCLVIAIDESATQTRAIFAQQRFAETLEGWEQQFHARRIREQHQNAQRCLRPFPVVNPYADQLGFIARQTRHRRDHQKYLTLIKTVALLHQYQREIKQTMIDGKSIDYIEVTPQDISMANALADQTLRRSIDELAEPTRRLLAELCRWISDRTDTGRSSLQEVVFTRREAREALGWTATQLNQHIERLCRDEYVVRHAGGSGKLCRYSLLYNGLGVENQETSTGLVDTLSLKQPTRPKSTAPNLSGGFRSPFGLSNPTQVVSQ
jgi:DNA primase